MDNKENEMFKEFMILKKIVLNKYPKKKETFEKAEQTDEDTVSRNPEMIKDFCEKEKIDFDEILNIYSLQNDMVECNVLLNKLMTDHHRDMCIAYELVKDIFKKYVDMREYYYPIVSAWIIGTYFHKMFVTYPYLFWNAMRGSGKSRVQNLISHLANGGEQMVSISESVLFRTAKSGRTICIDEMETINTKEKQALRELLQAAYKKGIKVKRLSKAKTTKKSEKKDIEKESYEIEEFEVFCPISMANIKGMNDVLSDRCLTLLLEKSNKTKIINLMEIFKSEEKIATFCSILKEISVGCVENAVCVEKGVYTYRLWNAYIRNISYTYTHTTISTYLTQTTLIHLERLTKCFDEITSKRISGRNLELSFPLLIISFLCGDNAFNEVISGLELIIKEKIKDDVTDSWDIGLYEFIAKKQPDQDFIGVNDLTQQFGEYIGNEMKSQWVGRALKRLGLVLDKRRVGRGVEVRLNYQKAIDNIQKFKPDFKVEITTIAGKYYKRGQDDFILMPCKICGATHSKGWQYEDTKDGKAVCDVCAGAYK
jgi:hypothetical protein